jgi:hypothetical protein
MNERLFSKILERLQNLDCKSPDQTQRDPLKVIIFDEFVEIDGEKLKRNNQVLSKHAVVFDSDDVVGVIGVVLLQVQQDL